MDLVSRQTNSRACIDSKVAANAGGWRVRVVVPKRIMLWLSTLLLAPVAAVPATALLDESSMETRVFLMQSGDADDPTALGGFARSGWHNFVPPDALPDAARQPGTQEASLVVAFDPTGAIVDCTPRTEEGAALAEASCAALRSNARFAPRYAAPGEGIASRRIFTVRSTTRSKADWAAADARISPAPPPPPGIIFSLDQKADWPPVVAEYPNIVLPPLPKIADLAPAEVRGTPGVTGLYLGIAPDGERRCLITEASGDMARDAAACRIAQALRVRYSRPCDLCYPVRIPMLLDWNGAKSAFRLPVQSVRRAPVAIHSGLRQGEFGGVRPSGDRQHATLYVAVDPKGKATGCRIIWSSGDGNLDQKLCDALIKKGRFAGGSDVFGRPVTGEATVYVRFKDIFPAA